MKLVLDTNIWISGLLLPNSQAGKLIQLWILGKINLVVSQELLDELETVLNYPKIIKRLQWPPEKIRSYIELIAFQTEIVLLNNIEVKIPQDPDDEKVLATLLQSGADYLISGDDDLLSLANEYDILSLADFFKIVDPEF